MLLCEVHGMFAKKYAVRIDTDILGGEYELCPFCMRERVNKREVV
jgi:hypothetical protein